jgi:hypothetical protein
LNDQPGHGAPKHVLMSGGLWMEMEMEMKDGGEQE